MDVQIIESSLKINLYVNYTFFSNILLLMYYFYDEWNIFLNLTLSVLDNRFSHESIQLEFEIWLSFASGVSN